MAYLSDQNTTLGQPAELSIFTLPANQVAIQKIYYSECRPLSSFQSDEAPIEIAVPGQGNEYIDLRRNVELSIQMVRNWQLKKRRALSIFRFKVCGHR